MKYLRSGRACFEYIEYLCGNGEDWDYELSAEFDPTVH